MRPLSRTQAPRPGSGAHRRRAVRRFGVPRSAQRHGCSRVNSILALVVFGVLSGCSSDRQGSKVDRDGGPKTIATGGASRDPGESEGAPAVDRTAELKQALRLTHDLPGAVTLLRPFMVDLDEQAGSRWPNGVGDVLLAAWASRELKWVDVALSGDEDPAKMIERPESFRGAKLCARGALELARSQSRPRELGHLGELTSRTSKTTYRHRVRLVGTLPSKFAAVRVCGIVIGRVVPDRGNESQFEAGLEIIGMVGE